MQKRLLNRLRGKRLPRTFTPPTDAAHVVPSDVVVDKPRAVSETTKIVKGKFVPGVGAAWAKKKYFGGEVDTDAKVEDKRQELVQEGEMGREELVGVIAEHKGQHPLKLLEQLTEDGVFLTDLALGHIIEKVAGELAEWGARRNQEERAKLGKAVMKKVEDLCAEHDAGSVSASAILYCCCCVPLPSTAQKVFKRFIDDDVRLSAAACETYVKMLLAFSLRNEAREGFLHGVRAGASFSTETYNNIMGKSTVRYKRALRGMTRKEKRSTPQAVAC